MRDSRMMTLMIASAAGLILSGCAGDRNDLRYEAEKSLFTARKQAGELAFPTLSGEFLDRAVGSYRTILEKYGDDAKRIEGMEMIVVSAAMELAELEFRAERYDAARGDFIAAYNMADGIPAARANALWSAGFISHLIRDDDDARMHYSRFIEEFLEPQRAMETARFNRRYLLTPIRIAEIELQAGNRSEAQRRLGEAERLFRHIIDTEGAGAEDSPHGDLSKEMQFNLLTVYLLGERWEEARAAVDTMKERYLGKTEIPGLLMIEARIMLDGLHDEDGAISILRSIARDHPRSREAPTALLTIANTQFSRQELRLAAGTYRELIDLYSEQPYPEVVEATWQLGRIEEAQGNWVDASSQFSSVYTDYPTTLQGMEAPLHIARHYREAGETDAARAAFERAERLYQRLASERYSETIRVFAEEYLVRALAEQGRWDEAAAGLIALPGRYPGYQRFMGNLLMAASIYENELGDDRRAVETLRLCLARYPGTDLAAEAQRQIARITAKR